MKKFLTLGNILVCCGAVLALVSILLMFAPAISMTVSVVKESVTSSYTGVQVAFGYTEASKIAKDGIPILKFSFGNFLPYLLALVGIVFAVLAILGKLGKISGFVASGCFLVAGVLFFCALPMTIPASEANLLKEYTLGLGAIFAGILSVLAAALCAVPAFIKKN